MLKTDTYCTVYTVVFPITMIAYVVINENTVMLPVTFPVAHIMTIDDSFALLSMT